MNTILSIGGMAILILIGAWWVNRPVRRTFTNGLIDGLVLAHGVILGAVLFVIGIGS